MAFALRLDRGTYIAGRHLTACQVRDRVGSEIRAMHPFSQFERLRCQRFDHARIEQEEPGGPQLEQLFAASFDL
jgi:hypothetical protein